MKMCSNLFLAHRLPIFVKIWFHGNFSGHSYIKHPSVIKVINNTDLTTYHWCLYLLYWHKDLYHGNKLLFGRLVPTSALSPALAGKSKTFVDML